MPKAKTNQLKTVKLDDTITPWLPSILYREQNLGTFLY